MLLRCTTGDLKVPPSNSSDNVTELNEISEKNHDETFHNIYLF